MGSPKCILGISLQIQNTNTNTKKEAQNTKVANKVREGNVFQFQRLQLFDRLFALPNLPAVHCEQNTKHGLNIQNMGPKYQI